MKHILKKCGFVLALMCAVQTISSAEGDAYEWPAYSPTIYYNFKEAGKNYTLPTQDAPGDCINAATGVVSRDYWSFIYGANRNSVISDLSIDNLLDYFNQEFTYITDSMGWPRDRRAEDGYRSAVYLYGSMECTGSNDPSATGGWQTIIDGYPAVTASYYPVYSFDPSCPYNDRVAQMDAMIHEGIHCILTDLGAKHVHWFQEGGNTWLQQEMHVRRSNVDKTKSNAYSGMGFLNGAPLIAPFMPIECYSGWLLDGSFGGPGAQGVGNNNWRSYLGGAQYGNLFPTFLGLWVSMGAVPWIWANTPNASNTDYILETIGKHIGDTQIRRLIMEYRAKLAMLDMQGWSEEMRTLLNSNFGRMLGCEAEDNNWDATCAIQNTPKWYATPYATVTESNGILTPNSETTPGWSGANIVPLKVNGTLAQVKLTPIGDNMSLQLCYRATDGTPVYSEPVLGEGTASLKIDKTPSDNVIFAVVCNTDYVYKGEETRTKHHNYTLTLVNGISGAESATTRWYNNFVLDYDWTANCNNCDEDTIIQNNTIQTIATIDYPVELKMSSSYEPATVSLNLANIASSLGITETDLIAANLKFYGINVDSSYYKTSTANDPGHWFNATGDVVTYGESSVIYSELNLANGSVNIGHFPDKVSIGDEFKIAQAIIIGNQSVRLNFNVKIIEGLTTSNELANANGSGYLKLQREPSRIIVKYHVPYNNADIKLSLYTAAGFLITHLEHSKQAQGDYYHAIDFNETGLPNGAYIIKYSWPGHSISKLTIGSK